MTNRLNLILFLIVFIPLQVSVASTGILEAQRKEFLVAEKLLRKSDDSLFFSKLASLKDYPLYPYLYYQWLKKNLKQTNKIKSFLIDYKDTRYAQLLRYKWQIHLAKNKKWVEYINQYQLTKNVVLQCHYYRAKYNVGEKKEALLGAKKLWVKGKSQPRECDAIFKVLKKSSYFTKEMLWQRFNASFANKKIKLARNISKLMNKKDQRIANLWLKVHANPYLITNKKLLNKNNPQAGLIFAHGIDRLASKNLAKAISLWDARKKNYTIIPATVNRIEQRLAMSLAFRRDERAYGRLSQLKKPDLSTQEWRVRAALIEQNWQHVEQSIDALDKETQKKDKWTYWLARALEKTGKLEVANFMFEQLSDNRSFYGYLAADKVNRSYQLSDRPIKVTPETFKRFKQRTDFRVVAELIKVKKRLEAKRQWWYAVRKLDKKKILLAAKYAQELKWTQIAIFTIAKAKYWDDISIRFPLGFEKTVHKYAAIKKLDAAIIFAIIRRESAFSQRVKSPVGATGLMQIMPKTGKEIAKQLKHQWRGNKDLLNADTNIRFGSYYYKKLLNKFDGHYALAAAGYNAGPHRVKKWLPKKQKIAADIWIETIPFKETRAYVAAVLTYALIYQKKMMKNNLTMMDFVRDVKPR